MIYRIAMLVLALSGLAPSQDVGPARPIGDNPAVSTVETLLDYKLGPGDLLDIKVFGVDDLSQTSRINSSGVISLPLLGSIEASGLTVVEVEKKIKSLLADQRLVRDPQVTVFIRDYRSQPIYVLGAVQKPGQYMMTSKLRLVDAITMAGGLDLVKAGDTILVKRPATTARGKDATSDQPNPEDQEIMQISVNSLLEKADPSANIALQSGDIIQVTERKPEAFYVVGDVGRAGAFPYPREKRGQILITQAIALAGGPTKTAKVSRGILVRYAPEGGRQQLAVDFNAILKGEKPDLPVLPNDIIFIPGSAAKTFGYGLSQAVPWAVANGLVFAIP